MRTRGWRRALRLASWTLLAGLEAAIFTIPASYVSLWGQGALHDYADPWWRWWQYLLVLGDPDFPDCARWEGYGALAGLVLPGAALVRLLTFAGQPMRGPMFRRWGRARPAVRAASDLHGDADWLPMAKARRLFPGPHPGYGGVVVGEAYRVDLDSVARVAFDPNERRTWGQGGKAPLLIDPCTEGATHGTVVAGSGGYKTTAITIPTLAAWAGSAVVNDPASQVGAMVEAMRRAMGHEVRFLRPGGDCMDVLGWINPADVLAETHVLEVLDWLCGDVADKAKGDNPIFPQGARKLLACLLADMLWDPSLPRARKNLREFRARVTTPEKKMKGRLQEIAEGSHSALARDYARTVMDTYVETFSGVYFHATTETDFLAVGLYADMLSRADFDPAALCGGRLTVILQISEAVMKATPALGRVLVGTMRAVVRRAEGALNGRVLFLLDETRLFGRLEPLADIMTGDRKLGLTCVTMWQNESDLAAIWKENAGVFSANSSWTLYAATSDLKTSEHVSKECGRYTVLARTQGSSSGASSGGSSSAGSRNRGANEGLSEQGRDLISPAEVRLMRADEAIILRRGTPPIRCGRAIWFRHPDMIARIEGDADRYRNAAE